MKTIALAALLLAAACSKKTADCETSISKGVDDLTTTVKSRAVNPQMQERMTSALGKLKATLIKRCTEDKWAPEALACFNNIPNMKGLQDCEAKLTEEQRKKVSDERRALMRGGAGNRMPDLPGHPQTLTPAGGPDGTAPGAPADPAVPPPGSAPPPGSPAPAATPPAATPPAAPPPAGSAAPAKPSAGSAAPSSGW